MAGRKEEEFAASCTISRGRGTRSASTISTIENKNDRPAYFAGRLFVEAEIFRPFN
ncbi:MAG: hypothetical protein ACLRSW_00815 [Christensenellaceae bacterium]